MNTGSEHKSSHPPVPGSGAGFSLVEFSTRRRVTVAMVTLTFEGGKIRARHRV